MGGGRGVLWIGEDLSANLGPMHVYIYLAEYLARNKEYLRFYEVHHGQAFVTPEMSWL